MPHVVAPSPRVLGAVVLGGAVGVAARAALTLPFDPTTAVGIVMLINEAGSFLLGLIVGWLDHRRPLTRAFLGTGAMGGFTTYSGFAVAVAGSAATAPALVLGTAALSLAGGVVAAAIGLWIGERWAPRPPRPEDAE